MATPDQISQWAERLLGLERARTADAIAELRAWRLPHLERGLLEQPDLDTITATVLLVESVAALVAQGVAATKLMKKLRDAKTSGQFWPAWAEIRGAAILIGREDYAARIEMEPDAAAGKHADFRLYQADGQFIDIEFKAVGLSNAEVAWHQEAAKHFNRLTPPVGLASIHGWLDRPVWVRTEKRDRSFEKSARLSKEMLEQFPDWAEVRGVAIIGHETEDAYIRRAAGRLTEAFGQMASSEEAWLGLWWGNGAPLIHTPRILDEAAAPAHVVGVASVGQAVAVPWNVIHVFALGLPRDADGFDGVDSTVDDTLAERVLDRFESSSGIRPTQLRAPGRESTILLRRDGRRRIFPFNLLFDSDPRSFAGTRAASPVQDVQILE